MTNLSWPGAALARMGELEQRVGELEAENAVLQSYIKEAISTLDQFEPELRRREQDLAVVAVMATSGILRSALARGRAGGRHKNRRVEEPGSRHKRR